MNNISDRKPTFHQAIDHCKSIQDNSLSIMAEHADVYAVEEITTTRVEALGQTTNTDHDKSRENTSVTQFMYDPDSTQHSWEPYPGWAVFLNNNLEIYWMNNKNK